MVEIDDSLYIIKPRAIYALQTADQIDRERANIHLPKVVTQQVFAVGSESEIVGKTLLTAITLLDKARRQTLRELGSRICPPNRCYTLALEQTRGDGSVRIDEEFRHFLALTMPH